MRGSLALFVAGLAVAACGGSGSDSGGAGSNAGGSAGNGKDAGPDSSIIIPGTGGTGATGGSGGAGGSGAETGCITGLQSIAISPAGQTVAIGASPTSVNFTATATLGSGSSDATSRLTWTATRSDDTPPGTFTSAGVYQPQAGVGGTVTIKATDGCKTGQTTVTLRLETTFKDPGSAITGRFGGPVVTNSATKTPLIVYPSDQTRFPRNIYKVLFQWKKSGNDYFRLTFDGPGSKTVVYSDGVRAECQASAATSGCMETDSAIWQAIAGSNAGAVATLTIDGVTTGDSNVYRSAPIHIGFSKQDVKGAIFYWSTTAAGIRRASISDADPEAYVVAKPIATVLPNNNGAVKCVACHTVSRSGKKLFAFTQAGSTGEFVYDVTLEPPPNPLITTQISTQKGFGTFRPDDKRVVATIGSLLAEFDADSKTKITNLPVAKGTNPDWSPTGTELAFSDQGGDSPGNANLKIIAYSNGTWGAVRTLVEASGLTNLFPSYSPDGAYVAYARGKGGHGDKTFQLWLAKADGTQTPVELVTANRVVNSQMTAGQHENNMPTWAPPGDFHWVAFNSVRPYGVVYPNGGTQQIWVAAIDPAKLGTKQDPSFPAFRFSFQGLAENNHRAFWTLDVRDPPDAGPSCAGLGSVCGGSTSCCTGLTCSPNSDLGHTCQTPPPADAGACLTLGATCDQTSGPACCNSLVCDLTADGGAFACQSSIVIE